MGIKRFMVLFNQLFCKIRRFLDKRVVEQDSQHCASFLGCLWGTSQIHYHLLGVFQVRVCLRPVLLFFLLLKIVAENPVRQCWHYLVYLFIFYFFNSFLFSPGWCALAGHTFSTLEILLYFSTVNSIFSTCHLLDESPWGRDFTFWRVFTLPFPKCGFWSPSFLSWVIGMYPELMLSLGVATRWQCFRTLFYLEARCESVAQGHRRQKGDASHAVIIIQKVWNKVLEGVLGKRQYELFSWYPLPRAQPISVPVICMKHFLVCPNTKSVIFLCWLMFLYFYILMQRLHPASPSANPWPIKFTT